ncbi:MAG: Gfo/Idh/MocA family oxidoreductase [Pirellulaceae bacterium]|nr:Gfo/Idh/MocA family oxidoreductase [Pirellulaceae bacterium]
MSRLTNRRQLLSTAVATGAGFWVGGSTDRVQGRSAGDKLNVAVVGAGKGSVGGVANLPAMGNENVVAICDIDDQYAGEAFEKNPQARRWKDYRQMLEQQKDIEAVVVSTPDHTHAPISLMAMRMGKHVYCEKPLARTIYEARLMAETAKATGVVTQMGNQGTSHAHFLTGVRAIQSGALGQVREVQCWTDRPTWPQGIERPTESPPVPAHVDWNLFLGPAPQRPYHPAYHPFIWRGWWDFGTGVLGDMVCHVANLAYLGLQLEYPDSVEVKSSPVNDETGPQWCVMRYHFPARGDLPPVRLHWYEGVKPEPYLGQVRPLSYGHALASNGCLIIGDRGAILTENMYCTIWKFLPEERYLDYVAPEATRPTSSGHHQEWIRRCKGQDVHVHSDFQYAAKLTESLLVGNLALRVGEKIEWDGPNMKAKNCPAADQYIRPEYHNGWTL